MNLIYEHLILVLLSLGIVLAWNILFNLSLVLVMILCIVLVFFNYENKSKLSEYLTMCLLANILLYCLESIIKSNYIYIQLKVYLISLCLYHIMEYMFVLNYHPEQASFDSFLINQSAEWVVAIVGGFIEYFLEIYFFESKENTKLIIIGSALMMIGHVFRIGALFTAKSNFTHQIAYRKKRTHELVKSGIYKISRHPSYFGFFIWSVGSQLLCCNPFCTLAYSIILYRFFKDRITQEEILLIGFFGNEYLEYRQQTPILIPFIELDPETIQASLEHYKANNTINNPLY